MSLHHALRLIPSSLAHKIPASTRCARVQCCTTTGSYLACSLRNTTPLCCLHHPPIVLDYPSSSTGRRPYPGATKTWTAMPAKDLGWPVCCRLAPRGAAERICTQYAALVPNALGEKDYSAYTCCATACCSTFLTKLTICGVGDRRGWMLYQPLLFSGQLRIILATKVQGRFVSRCLFSCFMQDSTYCGLRRMF